MENPNQPDQIISPTQRPKDKSTLVLISISVFVILILVGIALFLVPRNRTQTMRGISSNLLPMYGGQEKTALQIQADKDFIDAVVQSREDRKTVAAGIVSGAWEFARAGDSETAMKRFNQAWLLDPNNADIYKGYLSIIPYDRFEILYEYSKKVADQNPDQATIQCFLGAIRTNMANFTSISPEEKSEYLKQGEVEFQKGLKIDEMNPFCQINYGANLFYADRYPEAWYRFVINYALPDSRLDAKLVVDTYERVKSLGSANEYLMLGLSYDRLGRQDEALEIVQSGLNKYPQDAFLNCELGYVYLQKWYSDPSRSGLLINQSEKYLKLGLGIDPKAGFCHFHYAILLHNKSKHEEAWREVHKARSLGWKLFDQTFMKSLEAAFPEPKE